MARTVGRRRPSSSPLGDYQAKCHYCGVVYYRSELRRDGAGNLMCGADDGIDALTLDKMNAEMTPPPRQFVQDATSEAKVVEVAPSLLDKIGGTTFLG